MAKGKDKGNNKDKQNKKKKKDKKQSLCVDPSTRRRRHSCRRRSPMVKGAVDSCRKERGLTGAPVLSKMNIYLINIVLAIGLPAS